MLSLFLIEKNFVSTVTPCTPLNIDDINSKQKKPCRKTCSLSRHFDDVVHLKHIFPLPRGVVFDVSQSNIVR